MPIKSLKEKEKKILARIKQLISREFEIDKIYYFGSRVRGTSSRKSDYDVVLITRESLDWRQKRRISDITLEVDLEFDVVTDIKVYSKHDIQHTLLGQTPFMEEVIQNGLLYE